jgi:hypothetical protein
MEARQTATTFPLGAAMATALNVNETTMQHTSIPIETNSHFLRLNMCIFLLSRQFGIKMLTSQVDSHGLTPVALIK